jgi:hypothetical protein
METSKKIKVYGKIQKKYWISFAFAWIVWQVKRYFDTRIPPFYDEYGRRDDPHPIVCKCGWAGAIQYLIHGYRRDPNDREELIKVSYCPDCNHNIIDG